MVGNYDQTAKQLLESKSDLKARLALVTQIRENIEVAHTTDYEVFLRYMFPAFLQVLKEIPPQFVDGDEQQIRIVIIEILNRLPNTDVLRPYAVQLCHLGTNILATDNEDNGVIFLRIIFEVHKNYAPQLDAEVPEFINFFIGLYKNLPRMVQNAFAKPKSQMPAPTGLRQLTKSSESFSVLTEFPLAVMLVFQLYTQYIDPNIQILIPLMIGALSLKTPIQPTPGQRPGIAYDEKVYNSFIGAQVKTLSFLTYVFRGFSKRVEPHRDTLASCAIGLLVSCPADVTSTRKELLVAIRHIIATDFRYGFLKKMDFLLDENIMTEFSRSQDLQRVAQCRQLAYSVLADAIHHFRSELAPQQLSKVLYIFSRSMHDPTLPESIHTASARIILNLVDYIYRLTDPELRGSTLLARLLSALVTKFETLKDHIPRRLDHMRAKALRLKAMTANAAASTNTNGGAASSTSSLISPPPRPDDDQPEESIREVKQLMYTMVFGLKTVCWCIHNFVGGHSGAAAGQPPGAPGQPAPKRANVMDEETSLIAQFLENGLKCLKIYNMPVDSQGVIIWSEEKKHIDTPHPTTQEEKDILESFAGVFVVLEPRNFRDVFSVKMETLFQQIVENSKLPMLIIPQHFLSSPNVSKTFADILLSFLVKRMADMSTPPNNNPASAAMLNLFRIVFGSVTLFPDNEGVLRPYLNQIVSQAMTLATEVKQPMNYFTLLRALFRSIGGGKFEALYKEFLPLLPDLLQGLMKMHVRGPHSIREISIELCLTVPARLSSLLPFIPLLMKAVLLALQARDEQVIKLGLRTLEFWVDNLNPEYLYPHMCEVLNDLLRSLCALLRPYPSPFGPTALSILGKLGGRNRRFMVEEFKLDHRIHAEEGLAFGLRFHPPHQQFMMAADPAIDLARALILEQDSVAYTGGPITPVVPSLDVDSLKHAKLQAYLFLKASLTSMMNLTHNVTNDINGQIIAPAKHHDPVDTPSLMKASTAMAVGLMDVPGVLSSSASALYGNVSVPMPAISPPIAPATDNHDEKAAVRARLRRGAEEKVFRDILFALIVAASDENLMKDTNSLSDSFVGHIARHFALIFASPSPRPIMSEAKEIDPVVFLDAVVDVLCEENAAWTAAAENVLKVFVNSLITMMGKPAAGRNHAITELVSRLSHCCYQDVWERRHAGCVGLTLLVNHFSSKWVHTNQMEIMKALIHTFTDIKSDFATQTSTMANATLDKIIKVCCTYASGGKPMVIPVVPSTATTSSSSSSSSSDASSSSAAASLSSSRASDASSTATSLSSNVTPSVTATTSDTGGEEKTGEEGDISMTDVSFTSGATTTTTAGSTSSTTPGASPSPTAADGYDAASSGATAAVPTTPATNADGTPVAPTTDASASVAATPIPTDGEGKNEIMTDATVTPATPAPDGSVAVSTPAPGNDTADPAGATATAAGTTTASTSSSSASTSSSSSSSSAALLVEDHGPPLTEKQQTTIRNFMLILAPELLSGIAAIRECAQRLLSLVSELTGRSISQILLPYRERFVGPLRGHSMHATPLMTRIGYISTATYCLSLRPPFINVGDLLFLLKEIITDVQEEDRNFGGNMSGRAGRAVLHVKLRVESIKLMSAALASDEVMRPDEANGNDSKRKPKDYQDLKHQVIKVFFRALLSRNKDVIAVARKGLKAVIEREKLPKELLQQCLRPVLLNLTDLRKLSVSLLDGLYRLLELLSNCFNVTLGERLLDHLRNFSDPDALTKMRGEILADKSPGPKLKVEDEVKVCAAIVDLFHLLTPVPSKFLEPFISTVMRLEAMLPQLVYSGGYGQGASSPYRVPLIKFLNVGPRKSIDFFLKNLTNRKLTQMFQSIMKAPEAEPMRAILMKSPELIVASTFNAESIERAAANQAATAAALAATAANGGIAVAPVVPQLSLTPQQYEDLILQGITLVHTLSGYQPKWLVTCEPVFNCLVEVWESEGRRNRLHNEEKLPLSQLVESKLLVECFINCCRANKDEISLLWRLLSVFPVRTLVDYTFVSNFLRFDIIDTYSVLQKKNIIKSWLKLFNDPTVHASVKMKGSKYVVYPMLKAAFRARANAMTAAAAAGSSSCAASGESKESKEIKQDASSAAASSLVTTYDNKMTIDHCDLLDAESIESIVKSCSLDEPDEDLRIELLRLITLLVKWLPLSFVTYRRDMIKFAWNHFKGEKSPKMWAYLAICHLMAAFDTPSKVILQIYVALLRMSQPEHKVLVRKAFDILMPALPKRLPAIENKHPTWVKWTKKMIVEEGHVIPQLIHIWTLIVRHPASFYPSRAQFMPQMVNTLNRLGLAHNRPAEQKRLAIDIAELILVWDRRFMLEHGLITAEELEEKKDTKDGKDGEAKKGDAANALVKTEPGTKRQKMDTSADGALSPTGPISPVSTGSTNVAPAAPPGTTSTASIAPYDPVDTSADGESKQQAGDEKGSDAWGSTTGGDTASGTVGAVSSSSSAPSSSAAASSAQSSSSRFDPEYRPSPVMVEVIVTFTVRLALGTCEAAESRPLSERCLALLRSSLKIWRDADFKFVYMEKILFQEQPVSNDPNHQQHRDPLAQLVCALEIVNLLLQYQSPTYIGSNTGNIAKIVQKCLKTSDPSIRKGLYELMDRLLTMFPLSKAATHPAEFTTFYRGLREYLITQLKQSATDVVPPLLDKHQVPLLIGLLTVLCKHNPTYLDLVLPTPTPPPSTTGVTPPPPPPTVNASYPQLLKILARLSKDHITKSDSKAPANVAAANAARTGQVTRDTPDEKAKAAALTALLSETIVKGLRLLRDHIKDLSTEHKKNYFITVSTLLDKSNDTTILLEIANMIQSWTTTDPGGLLPKDKAMFIFKMIRFERMTDQPELLHVFFNTLLQVFTAPGVKAGSDFLVRLQKPFMIGLRARDRTYRRKFTAIFHRYVSRSLLDRMHYILGLQDWEPLSDSIWMTQACDMLLATIADHDYIRDVSKTSTIPPFDLTLSPRKTATTTSPVKTETKASVITSNGSMLPGSGVREKKQPLMRASKAASSSSKKSSTVVKIEPGTGRVTHIKRKHDSVTTANGGNHTNGKSSTTTGAAATATATNGVIHIKEENGSEPSSHIDTGASTPVARQSLLRGHTHWLSSLRDTRVDTLINPLRDLIHASPRLTYSLWIHLLPIAWAKLAPDDRTMLTPSIEALLAKDWHRKQVHDRPNQIQVLLESFAGCYPLPEIKPELLFFLAKQYNAWHTVVSQLERRVNSLSLEVILPATANASQEYLGHLYKLLNERDIWAAAWRRRVASDYTKSALALEQFGLWARAQDQWYLALSRVKANDPQAIIATRPEQNLWEEEWVRCARHLNQWDVLGEFARSINHPELTLEAAWRNNEWATLKEGASRFAISETPHGKLFQIYMAVQERRLGDREIDKLCDGGSQLALREWQGLPTFVGSAHLDLLQRFQRLVELQESGQMLLDINNYASRQGPLPHFKSFITTWRERLCNKWEEIPTWSDVFTWRTHMFSLITSTPALNTPDLQPALSRIHDTPWTMIKLATVARKQQLPTVCLSLISKVQTAYPQMDALDAFNQRREQIKTCLQSPMDIRAALNLISNCNLDYFAVEQKAEMFRLKGEALQHLGYGDESNTAFSACLSISDTYGKGWLSWGMFCDRVFTLKKDLQWAEHSVVCYLQAITHKATRSRQYVPRTLWLVGSDPEPRGPVNKAFAKFSDQVPPWVWLLWIPQLLPSLSRPEGQTVKALLLKIARAYPQALYYGLRAYFLEKRETRAPAQAAAAKAAAAAAAARSATAAAANASAAANATATTATTTAATAPPTLSSVPSSTTGMTSLTSVPAPTATTAPTLTPEQQAAAAAAAAAQQAVAVATGTAVAAPAPAPVPTPDPTAAALAPAPATDPNAAAIAAYQQQQATATGVTAPTPTDAAGTTTATTTATAGSYPNYQYNQNGYTYNAQGQPVYTGTPATATTAPVPPTDGAQPMDTSAENAALVAANAAAAAAAAAATATAQAGQYPAQPGQYGYNQYYQGTAGATATATAGATSTQPTAGQPGYGQYPQGTYPGYSYPTGAAATAVANAAVASAQQQVQQQQQPTMVQQPDGTIVATYPPQPTATTTATAPVAPQPSSAQPGQPGVAAAAPPPAQPPQGASTGVVPPVEEPPVGGYSMLWMEELLTVLRRSSPLLTTEIDGMLDDFARRFKPTPEEELLGAVHQLGYKFLALPVTPQSADEKIDRSMRTTLERLLMKFFTPEPPMGDKRELPVQSPLSKYKAAFERDFLPPSSSRSKSTFPTTVSELVERLKKWKHHLQYKVGARNQIALKLERISSILSHFQSFDIEVPGQYSQDQEPNLDQNVILTRFEPEVDMQYAHGTSAHGYGSRRVGMRGSDGRIYYFLVQYCSPHYTRSDERMAQFYVLMNHMMIRYKETRKRNLMYHIPLVVPLSQRFRLMDTHPSQVSLEDVYEQSCASRGVEPDAPILYWRDAMRKVEGGETNQVARQRVFQDICSNMVPDYILTRYVQRIIPNYDQLWAFKKEFGAQLALAGFMSYILRIGDRAPHKISFFKHSARIINHDFHPPYNEHLLIDSNEQVPLRLTRNLATLISPFILEGLFPCVLTAANSALISYQEMLRNYLFLFIRDDLVSYFGTKTLIPTDEAQRQVERSQKEKVMGNATGILKRLHSLMPSSTPDNAPGKAPQPINIKIHQLVKLAVTKSNLARQPPTWAPWY